MKQELDLEPTRVRPKIVIQQRQNEDDQGSSICQTMLSFSNEGFWEVRLIPCKDGMGMIIRSTRKSYFGRIVQWSRSW
jgi:hypothetical protein